MSAIISDAIDQAIAERFSLPRQIALVVVFNTGVAALVDMLGNTGFWLSFAYSQVIGLSNFATIHLLAIRAGRAGKPEQRDIFLGIAIGAVAGSALGLVLTGNSDRLYDRGLGGLAFNILLGLAFGTVAGYVLFSMIHLSKTHLELQQREGRQLAAEKALTETQLRLLQAQIEPHFLFNTLSNIHSLIDTEPSRAAATMEALIRLLRGTLQRTREEGLSLGDELDLIGAYLAIQRQRMGERLRYRIEVDDALRALPFPPMLLQPLVENAVLHGIEPALEGGEVVIKVAREEEMLGILIHDSGDGFGSGRSGNGVGLANVRERLRTLFGGQASCELSLSPQGTLVSLSMPER